MPAVGDRDHRQRVLATRCRQRRAVDGVNRDVAGRPLARADVLAVEQHGRLVLLALADHHHAVKVDRAEELAHGVDGGSIGAELVAPCQ